MPTVANHLKAAVAIEQRCCSFPQALSDPSAIGEDVGVEFYLAASAAAAEAGFDSHVSMAALLMHALHWGPAPAPGQVDLRLAVGIDGARTRISAVYETECQTLVSAVHTDLARLATQFDFGTHRRHQKMLDADVTHPREFALGLLYFTQLVKHVKRQELPNQIVVRVAGAAHEYHLKHRQAWGMPSVTALANEYVDRIKSLCYGLTAELVGCLPSGYRPGDWKVGAALP